LRRWMWPVIAGAAFPGVTVGTVVMTVHPVQSKPSVPAPAPALPPPPVVMTPTPAPAPPPPPPPPAPKLTGVLKVETAKVVATERGTIVDVARVGTVIARGAAVAHHRVDSAAFGRRRRSRPQDPRVPARRDRRQAGQELRVD